MTQTYLNSLNQALKEVLIQDERVYILGEDILDPYGGAFKVTKGLSSKFPDRITPTPISEPSLVGIALGMALRGLRPVVEIMFGDFITLCTDQIVNHASKLQAMYSGQISTPIVIRTPMGGGRGYGPTHSQSLEKLFLGTPHLRIIAPSHFHNPGELLKSSIIKDHRPTLFIEHKLLYPKKLILEERPPIFVELKKHHSAYPTAVVRNYNPDLQTSDIIIITYGGISRLLEPILKRLHDEEIRIVAYLPSIISSPPLGPLLSMIQDCPRVIVVEEGTENFNWGAEISSQIYSHVVNQKVKIRRIAADATVIPAAMHLEKKMLPSVKSIEQAIIEELI